jgi:two-component system, cell cycle response regulator DivK
MVVLFFPILVGFQHLVLDVTSRRTLTEYLTQPAKMDPDSHNPLTTRPTILVVDDFDDTRLLLRTWLERKGYRVIEAHNGRQAVEEAESSCPDLIIMDVEMPELDGLSATRQIRKVEKLGDVPVLAVSAYGAEQFRLEALAAGCNEYVSTPFEPAELEELIRSLVMH